MTSFFRRKDLSQLRRTSQTNEGFRRTLGPWQLSSLGIGFVIGTGIFVLTGHIAADNAGPAVCLAFLLAAIPASLVATCYAEMVATVPGVGGAYLYTATALGDLPAFLVGWTLTLTYCVGAATVATGWSSYARELLHQLTGFTLPDAVTTSPFTMTTTGVLHATGGGIDGPAAAIILLLSGVLLLGAAASMRFTMALVVLKVGVVVLFIITVGQHIDPALWHPFIPDNRGTFGALGLSGILQGASVAVFAYLGVDNLSTAVQEAKQPERTVPIAIAVTMGVAVVLYVGVCLVLTGVVPYAQLNVDHPITLAVRVTQNPTLEVLVQTGALAGLTSVLLIQLYGLPRILFAMGKDGLAPRWATRLGNKNAAPAVTTLVMGSVCAVAAAFTPIQVLAEVTAAGTLVTFICVSLGVAVLRKEHPRVKRKFSVPGGPYLVPGAATLTCFVLFALTPWPALAALAAWWIIGCAVYMGYRRGAQ